MKLHKKKVWILLVCMVIFTIITSVLCSFSPPVPSRNMFAISPETITTIDGENMLSMAYYQWKFGSFNNFKPVAAATSGGYIRLYLVVNDGTETYGFTDETTYSITSTASGEYNVMRMWLTPEGYGIQYIQTSTTINIDKLIFYADTNDTLVLNEAFDFATGVNGNDTIAEAAAEWYEAYRIISNYEMDIAEAESQGFLDGLDTGMDLGYQFGYESGVVSGREEGYAHGYQAGEANGYEEGYSLGYDDGYAAAEPGNGEVVTEIVYRDSVELNIPLIFNGMADAANGIFKSVDFNIFGINILGVLLSITILVILVFIFKKFKS